MSTLVNGQTWFWSDDITTFFSPSLWVILYLTSACGFVFFSSSVSNVAGVPASPAPLDDTAAHQPCLKQPPPTTPSQPIRSESRGKHEELIAVSHVSHHDPTTTLTFSYSFTEGWSKPREQKLSMLLWTAEVFFFLFVCLIYKYLYNDWIQSHLIYLLYVTEHFVLK